MTQKFQNWLYGVRLRGADGWELREFPLPQDEYFQHLRDQGDDVEAVREVFGFNGHSLGEIQGYMAVQFWWAFDESANCWRAPDEMLTPFTGTPTVVESVAVAFSQPISGGMIVSISAGDQSTEFYLDGDFDPVPDITPWLERILDGDYPRLFIDRDGRYTEFNVFPAEQGVRLHVSHFDKEWIKAMDIALDRLALIKGFYLPLVQLWESAWLADNWREWDWEMRFASNPAPECQQPYSVRSEFIDAYLAVNP